MKKKSSLLKEQPSGSVPDCLLWELVRNNHAHLKKTTTMNFSLESHNVVSLHSPKYTGYAHKPLVDVNLNTNGSLVHYKTRNLANTRRPSTKSFQKTLPKSSLFLNYLRKSLRKHRPDLLNPVLKKFTLLSRYSTDEKQES
ncbi:60S ribosomal protein L28 [Theileria orientalis strain Shintoku]|uniref:60S ribosomal protein L28 n=1 Tax=Theileria orientalis strain Shintoku TaxID=869250 RepID=J4D8S0_THEOR|nr:60S ribosomal protein L28 [Theileria orientalis strain Shintoku]PVC50958.1 60S ribosomal protein L28 [Theileria orientalis]BAM40965.1 60S ribosomal protein L28 [Theileria orientalis strain Shintoku]|eukprot:XP_009691266.1 60S ribosomal protein L28 [Theileria orientalis strain Shintoku]